jgi:hypothetical protein
MTRRNGGHAPIKDYSRTRLLNSSIKLKNMVLRRMRPRARVQSCEIRAQAAKAEHPGTQLAGSSRGGSIVAHKILTKRRAREHNRGSPLLAEDASFLILNRIEPIPYDGYCSRT